MNKFIPCTSDEKFKFINPNANDMLSNFSNSDLEELIYYIENTYLRFRQHLGFAKDYTFGFEIEFENYVNIREIINKVTYYVYGLWEYKSDGSLKHGGEIVSPKLNDVNSDWKELKQVCNIISENAKIGKNCGGHIHIGSSVLQDNPYNWLNFIRLWSAYENIIYRFCYGEYINARKNIQKYAMPMASDFRFCYNLLKQKDNLNLRKILVYLNTQRYQAVNFKNVKSNDIYNNKIKNTIEFRCFNGTLEPIIWQNNLNFILSFLEYAKNPNFNHEIINQRIERNLEEKINFSNYDEIFLDEALELCDLIFNNNFDKIYFLRQYLKSFEINRKHNIKTENFVRKKQKTL
ncbi:MAG: amidoligase family protein [Bacilli bacterium]